MPRIAVDALRGFSSRLLEAAGATPDIADRVADSLVRADLAGHHSHGVIRIEWYTEMVEEGELDPTATPTVRNESPIGALVHGRDCFGQILGREAVDLGVEKARETGVAVLGVRNGGHLGRIGEWAERAADEEMLFAAFVNVQGTGKLVAPAGSAERKLGTNPLAFGVPTFDELPFPVVLDIATSQVAHGKIAERAATGHETPAEWTITDAGEPVTDAEAFEAGAGAILPLGGQSSGYKGFGLAVIAELFAGIVSDGRVFGQASTDGFSNAAAFVTIDPTAFTDRADAVDRVAALAAYLHGTEPSPSVSAGAGAKGADDEVILPGEGEYRLTREGYDRGVPIADGILAKLADLAREQGVEDAVPHDAA